MFVTIGSSDGEWERRNVTGSPAALAGERICEVDREFPQEKKKSARNARDSGTKLGDFQANICASKAKLRAAKAWLGRAGCQLGAVEARLPTAGTWASRVETQLCLAERGF